MSFELQPIDDVAKSISEMIEEAKYQLARVKSPKRKRSLKGFIDFYSSVMCHMNQSHKIPE